jgi:hypothetical protein
MSPDLALLLDGDYEPVDLEHLAYLIQNNYTDEDELELSEFIDQHLVAMLREIAVTRRAIQQLLGFSSEETARIWSESSEPPVSAV